MRVVTSLLPLVLLAASAAGAASLPDNPLDGRFVFENPSDPFVEDAEARLAQLSANGAGS